MRSASLLLSGLALFGSVAHAQASARFVDPSGQDDTLDYRLGNTVQIRWTNPWSNNMDIYINPAGGQSENVDPVLLLANSPNRYDQPGNVTFPTSLTQGGSWYFSASAVSDTDGSRTYTGTTFQLRATDAVLPGDSGNDGSTATVFETTRVTVTVNPDGQPQGTSGPVTDDGPDCSSSSGGLSQSARIGLGVGLGVGIPLAAILGAAAGVMFMKRKGAGGAAGGYAGAPGGSGPGNFGTEVSPMMSPPMGYQPNSGPPPLVPSAHNGGSNQGGYYMPAPQQGMMGGGPPGPGSVSAASAGGPLSTTGSEQPSTLTNPTQQGYGHAPNQMGYPQQQQ